MADLNGKQRKFSVGLGIGIFLFPVIFSWFTLRKGYSRKVRVISFSWMAAGILLTVLSRSDNTTQATKEDVTTAVAEAPEVKETLEVAVTPAVVETPAPDISPAPGSHSMKIGREQLGAAWPLTVASGYLRCLNRSVIFEAGGTQYRVNGNRSAWGHTPEELDAIWRPDPEYKGLKVSVGPLIQIGLALCDGESRAQYTLQSVQKSGG